MFKSAIAAVAAAPFLSPAAMAHHGGADRAGQPASTAVVAGPYVNVEANAGLHDTNYTGTVTEAHVGYDFVLSKTVSGYAQVGPAVKIPDNGVVKTNLSGKVGATVAATDRVSVYGEYYFMTGKDLYSNVKAGVKYSF